MFGFVDLFLTAAWVIVAVPAAVGILRWRRRRVSNPEQPASGCLICATAVAAVLGGLLGWSAVANYLDRQPEAMAEAFLEITDTGPLQDLRSHYEDLGLDYSVYIYFRAEAGYVRELIRAREFVEDGGGRMGIDFSPKVGAPPIPPQGCMIYRRGAPGSHNLESLVTDHAHEQVWFTSIDY